MTKFKVGDKVRVTNTRDMNAPSGATATVVRAEYGCNFSSETYIGLEWDKETLDGKFQGDGGYYPRDFELIETPVVGFKIGDRVIVTKGSFYAPKIKVGLTGVVSDPIIGHNRDDNAPYVRFDETAGGIHRGWFFGTDHDGAIELLETPTAFPVIVNPRAHRAKAPQPVTILKHLKAGRSISPMEAIITYGIMRLAPAIHDLRSAGHRIQMELRKDRQGKTYARYQLAA
jgi:hypothetical protein